MFNRFLLAFVMLVGFMIPVAAAPDKPDISHGNGLLQACTSDVVLDEMVCFGYVQGVIDTLAYYDPAAAQSICTPYPSVTKGQEEEIVVKYLKENPATRHLDSPKLIDDAMHGAFPCPVK
jgi:hypothetical protein